MNEDNERGPNYRDFSYEPISDKHVSEVPGVSAECAADLAAIGYDKAEKLVAMYLMFDRNEILFKEWLSTFGVNVELTTPAIVTWCNAFM